MPTYHVTVDFRVQADDEEAAADDVQAWLDGMVERGGSANLEESPLTDYIVRAVA